MQQQREAAAASATAASAGGGGAGAARVAEAKPRGMIRAGDSFADLMTDITQLKISWNNSHSAVQRPGSGGGSGGGGGLSASPPHE